MSNSEFNSPSRSLRSSISEVDTPQTNRSTLFDGNFSEVWHQNPEYILVVGGLGYIGSHTCLELLIILFVTDSEYKHGDKEGAKPVREILKPTGKIWREYEIGECKTDDGESTRCFKVLK